MENLKYIENFFEVYTRMSTEDIYAWLIYFSCLIKSKL